MPVHSAATPAATRAQEAWAQNWAPPQKVHHMTRPRRPLAALPHGPSTPPGTRVVRRLAGERLDPPIYASTFCGGALVATCEEQHHGLDDQGNTGDDLVAEIDPTAQEAEGGIAEHQPGE